MAGCRLRVNGGRSGISFPECGEANRTGGHSFGPLRFSIEQDQRMSVVADDQFVELGNLPGCINQFNHVDSCVLRPLR